VSVLESEDKPHGKTEKATDSEQVLEKILYSENNDNITAFQIRVKSPAKSGYLRFF